MKFGCIPYRRLNKLRDSNDDLHESTSVDTTQDELNALKNVENIGVFNALTNPPPFEDVTCLPLLIEIFYVVHLGTEKEQELERFIWSKIISFFGNDNYLSYMS